VTLRPFGGMIVIEEERALGISAGAAPNEMLAREG
jgi:hypothetical protein